MFRNFTLALLGSASCLCAGIQQAAAIDGAALPEPKVIYAREPAPPAPSASLRPKRDRTPEPMGPGGGGYDPSKRRGRGGMRRRGP